MTIAQTVMQKLLSLPVDKQEEVLAYVEQLERKPDSPARVPLFNPEGLAADIGCDLSLEDFKQNRREM